MLWFNFILGLNFIFFCFKLIIIHYDTQKQRKMKFQPRIKLNHNIDNLKVIYKVLNYYKNDFSKFDEDKFINDFSFLDWNNISSDYMDANTKSDIFYDQISQFINYHVPRRKLSKREIKLSTKPWITKHILAKI